MSYERLYAAAPVWLQNLVCDAVGYRTSRTRYGSGWSDVWSATLAAQELLPGKLEELQAERLQAQMEAAGETSFWRSRFAEHDVRVRSSSPRDELAKLPVLTKAEVRTSANDILRHVREPVLGVRTSGSTGSPLIFRTTRTAHQQQWAVWWRYRGWHGLTRADWNGSFGGKMIVPRTASKPPFWRRVRTDRRWFFSAYHLSPASVDAYIDAMRRFGLRWLHGYPSALATLAHLARPEAVRGLGLRAVTTGAEGILHSQRVIMEDRFGCRVRQHYGLSEAVSNISECEKGRLHVDEDFALVEFLPIDGQPGVFRMIGTNLTNPVFPLFRYDTGDVVSIDASAECSCGRAGRVVASIDGRIEDSILLGDGTRIGRISVVFTALRAIREAQIVQSQVGSVTVRLVKDAGYDEQGIEKQLLTRLRERLGDECHVEIEYVDSIPRTSSGKLRLVVSSVQ